MMGYVGLLAYLLSRLPRLWLSLLRGWFGGRSFGGGATSFGSRFFLGLPCRGLSANRFLNLE